MIKGQANADLRARISEARVFYYEIAEKIGVSPATFTRIMRSEMSEDRRDQILKAIKELSAR